MATKFMKVDKFPIKIFVLSLLLTVLTLSWFIYSIYQNYQQSYLLIDKVREAMKVKGEILQYDEILTMSARMAASSGDLKWEDRYRKYEVMLDQAIAKAEEIVPFDTNHKVSSKTNVANQKLISMENQSFNYIRNDQIESAKKILFSQEYETQKKIYSEGMSELEENIENEVLHLKNQKRKKSLYVVALSCFLMVVLFVCWVISIKIFNKWNKKISEGQVYLIEAQKMLEHKVEERTSELKRAYTNLQEESYQREQAQTELIQAEKLASVGQMAGGIAHEINTPVQYIGDNLKFLEEEQAKILEALDECSEETKEKIDFDFLKDEIPNSIKQSIEGVDHVAKLVRSMKEFAHPGGDELKLIDINRSIENVVNVSRNEWKYVSDVDLNLDENLPQVPCLFGEFNQVLLNIIVNAAHAIEEKVKDTKDKGNITIATRSQESCVEIRISDTGTGIPEEIQKKIFDPFFTTKEVGKGTGQGLAIAYKLINEKLKGTIEVESIIGKGTTFVITLPYSKHSENKDS